MLKRTGDFRRFLAAPFDEAQSYSALRRAETIGRPVGSEAWLKALEAQTGRALMPARRGPKKEFGTLKPEFAARDGGTGVDQSGTASTNTFPPPGWIISAASHLFAPIVSPVCAMIRAIGIVGVIPVLAAGLALGSAGPVAAHPHVFADGHVVLDVNAGRELVAITNQWTFDAPFSAFAVTGLDTNGDGKLQKEELDELAETSMDSLQDYHFFTWATSRGADAQFSGPRDYAYTFSDGRLTLNFTMPLKKPLPLDATLQVEVFDPEYFVAYTFPDHGAVEIAGNAADCVASYVPPKPLDTDMMARLAAIPAEQHDLPPALADVAVGLAHIFTAHCP